jgi:signal transduction histidine kinase
VDVNKVIREMIVLLHNEAARYSVAIRTNLTAKLPQVIADRVQLQQVFMNLMLNGIEAMKEVNAARELTIKSERAQNSHLLISVSDTGMGLPISRSIVESHGGHLWATANSGRGTTFHFTLMGAAEGLQ